MIGWAAVRKDLRRVRFRWWQWRYRRAHWAQIRHWWIFKAGNKWLFRVKLAELYPPEPVLFPIDLGSRNETLWEFRPECKKEWVPTLLPGDTLEGIQKIAKERIEAGIWIGKCP